MFEKLRLLAHACVLAGLLDASVSAQTQAAPVRVVRLDWERAVGAEACIASDELAQRVEQRLEREVFTRASDALVIIAGTVGPSNKQGFSALIRVSAPDGTVYGSREVSVPDPDCRKLDDVVTLIISVTLRHEGGISLPDNVVQQLTDAPAPAPVPVPAPAPVPVPVPVPVPDRPKPPDSQITTPPDNTWRAQLEAGVGLITGILPSLSVAPLLRVQLELQKLYSFALEGRLGLSQTQRITSEPRGSLEYHSNALALLACVSPLRAASVALAVCVDGRVGQLSIQAEDFAYNFGASARWAELALAGSLRVALLGPTFAHLRLGLPWRIVRPRFKYQSGQGEWHDPFQMRAWGADLSLSLGVEF